MLKKIECYIQPFTLEPLTHALVALGVDGMSVTEVRGFGRQRGFASGQAPGQVKFTSKLKLEIVVKSDMVDGTVALIVKMARTGTVGAGKIFVLPVENAVRIGSGETGEMAVG